MKFFDLQAQKTRLEPLLGTRINSVMEHGKFIQGPEVFELEEKLQEFTGVNYCITCGNGTDAIQVALMALNIGPGDEVITPGFSYIAVAEAIKLLGAVPVYVDVEADTYNLSVQAVEAAITERTRAIAPVSLFGQCADYDDLNKLAHRYGLPVIEDAAQSFGATYFGKKSCNLTTIACTSFFPTKPLGCFGDGGAIFTNDKELAERLRCISKHGQERRYEHVEIGINSRLDTLQAAVLLSKIEILEDEIQSRNEIAGMYSSAISDAKRNDIVAPTIRAHNISAWAQYTIACSDRDGVSARLTERGIPFAVHYPKAIFEQKAYLDPTETCSVSVDVAKKVLSLPCHPYLTQSEIEAVIDAVIGE